MRKFLKRNKILFVRITSVILVVGMILPMILSFK